MTAERANSQTTASASLDTSTAITETSFPINSNNLSISLCSLFANADAKWRIVCDCSSIASMIGAKRTLSGALNDFQACFKGDSS
jgi:hypothetical protein